MAALRPEEAVARWLKTGFLPSGTAPRASYASSKSPLLPVVGCFFFSFFGTRDTMQFTHSPNQKE